MVKIKNNETTTTRISPKNRKSARIATVVILVLVLFELFLQFQNDEQVMIEYKIRPNSVANDSLAQNPSKKGFHPIYVYHGPDDSIKSLPVKSVVMKQNFKAGSQLMQDEIVIALTSKLRELLPISQGKDPFFIDLASNDAIQLSNTLLLEENGWKGLCIEPNPTYWYRLAHRKCEVVGTFVGGKNDMKEVDVSLTNEEEGGIVGEKMDNHKVNKQTTEKRYTISIRSLFSSFQVPKKIDYMSLDVEGAEGIVMEDFPFESYKISFLTVERPKLELQKLLKDNGYQFVIMLARWGETLWVHESVTTKFSLKEIEGVVRATSKHIDAPSRVIWDIKTGAYK